MLQILILLLSLNGSSDLEQYRSLKAEQKRLKKELQEINRQERKLKKYLQKNVYATVEYILDQPIEIGEKRKLIRSLLYQKLYRNKGQKRFIIKAIKNLPLLLIQRARNRAIKITKEKPLRIKKVVAAWTRYEEITRGTKYHNFATKQLKKYRGMTLPEIPKPIMRSTSVVKDVPKPKPLPRQKPLTRAPLFRGILINQAITGTPILKLQTILKQPSVQEILLIFAPCPEGEQWNRLKTLQQKQLPLGRYILLVSMDQTEQKIARCRRETSSYQVSIPVFKDPYHLIPHLYHLERWPSLLRINREGIILKQHTLKGITADEITTYLN